MWLTSNWLAGNEREWERHSRGKKRFTDVTYRTIVTMVLKEIHADQYANPNAPYAHASPCAPNADPQSRTGGRFHTEKMVLHPGLPVFGNSIMAARALLVGNICAVADRLNGIKLRPTGMVEAPIPSSASLNFVRNSPTLSVVIAQPQAKQMASIV